MWHTKMHFFAKCNSGRIAIQWFHIKHYLDYQYTNTSRIPFGCTIRDFGSPTIDHAICHKPHQIWMQNKLVLVQVKTRKCCKLFIAYIIFLIIVKTWKYSVIKTYIQVKLEEEKTEPPQEISNNVVCATSKGSDQPAHSRILIRTFSRCLNILWGLSSWPNIKLSVKAVALIFLSGRGSAISSAKQGKSGSIYNLGEN